MSEDKTSIIEESENLQLERIATVLTIRGSEYFINVDKAICCIAEMREKIIHENQMGWSLTGEYYKQQVENLFRIVFEPPSRRGNEDEQRRE